MSTLIKALLFQLCLMQMQCIRGASSEAQPMQQLLQLNDIVTGRINSTLGQYAYLRNQTKNEEFLRQYERLEMAVVLPVAQLDEKIRVYNEYIAYDKERLELGNNLSNVPQLRTEQTASNGHNYPLLNLFNNGTVKNQTRADTYSAFEKRVLKLLRKLGVYDPFTERVFKAIFSDEEQLKKLKKKLKELDDDDDNNKDNDCCLWDFVFALF